MKTLWWVEDEQDLREVFDEFLDDFRKYFDLKFVAHWNECEPVSGDIVIHDIYGVGDEPQIKKEDVTYYICSGSALLHETHVDLPKPFQHEDLYKLLEPHIEKIGEPA